MAFSVLLPAAAIFLATRSLTMISIRESGEDVTCEDSIIVRSAHGDGADGIIDSFISKSTWTMCPPALLSVLRVRLGSEHSAPCNFVVIYV